ncbi:alpha/beta hydrolase-fold protein [Pedobacter sp. Leaf176]|uniref:alpha/beta hydrolase-fold protein n=1 Tax=Pedobacter sp. Leaf176 TaxID=1736286 RepID=UPI0006FC8D4C|nr:alpha/beta hydrolase-fold protein [Pedobacter sp. Leaf176]KQR70194.1 hypothetical protein ASF92_09345 [Pedobacter sp. Leaf176]
MKKISTIIALLSVLVTASAQQVKLGDKNTITIHSSKENINRTIYLQLPKNYGIENKRYPLIILFDAQDKSLYNLTSSIIDRMTWTNDIPEAIFLGVVQNNRSQELNFEKSEQTTKIFLDFIKNDLLDYVNKNYKANGYVTLIGHSLGGQFVTNAMVSYPEIFPSVISISGALNYPNKDNTINSKVISKVERYLSATSVSSLKKQKYYFSSGDNGFQESGFKSGALKVDSLYKLHKHNVVNWQFDFLKGYNHMTTPLHGIPAGLAFVFKDWYISDSLAMDVLIYHKTSPSVVLKDKKINIAKSYGVNISLPRNALFQFAEYSLSQGKIDDAEALTKNLLNEYPDDEEVYGLMAEIFVKKGDISNAIKYYERAQSKSVTNKHAEKIKDLKKDQLKSLK